MVLVSVCVSEGGYVCKEENLWVSGMFFLTYAHIDLPFVIFKNHIS